MVLPSGYRDPDIIYSVVSVDSDNEAGPHLATFYSERAAKECIKQLRAEGWGDLALDLDFVHHRTQDWEFDR